ncbi:MAG TPA: SOS response-associated peptidase [Burkholderiales bacterium]|nr:SOS response-associated peptidase [Burkholderiales bacterium]
MCGRYVSPSDAEIERFWHIGRHNYAPFGPLYNVSPTALIPTLRRGDTGGLDLVMTRWGLIPFWWKDAKPPCNTFNARSEEAATKPMWRDPASKARCLVPALGWYEWDEVERVDPATGEVKKAKRPHFMHLPDRRPFAFAGLMSRWTTESATAEFTCAILTRDAVGPSAEIHTRMPIALPKDVESAWLDPALTDAANAIELARERAVTEFVHHPVNPRVNHTRNEGAELIEPVHSA